jgi:release factor glutamine methyltransferase
MQKPEEIAYKILNLSQKEKRKYILKILDKKFIVHPQVFSPKYFDDTELFVKYFPYKERGVMLEIGTGVGVIAIIAILKRKVNRVVATDINPIALKNAKENVNLYGLNKKIKVVKSDLFEKLKSKKFDVIFFNTPFCYTRKRKLSVLEKALFDYKYSTLRRFVCDAKHYIKKEGHIFLGFSSFFGDLKKFKKIVKNEDYALKLIKNIKTKREGKRLQLEIFEIIPISAKKFTC